VPVFLKEHLAPNSNEFIESCKRETLTVLAPRLTEQLLPMDKKKEITVMHCFFLTTPEEMNCSWLLFT
jgi:hypothetical protein